MQEQPEAAAKSVVVKAAERETASVRMRLVTEAPSIEWLG